MSPSQLPDDVVSVVEEVADLDRVVAALLVIPGSFLLVIVRSKDLLLLLVLLKNSFLPRCSKHNWFIRLMQVKCQH